MIKMKKIQTMLTMVLVALMAFTVQSCSKSDDKPDTGSAEYKLAYSISFQDQGDMTDAQVKALQDNFNKEQVGTMISDKQAESQTDALVDNLAKRAKEIMGNEKVKFTITVITTKVSNGAQICKWDIVYDNGSVSTRKY